MFAKIAGVVVVLCGTVSLLSAISGYRALRSDGISIYLVSMENPGSPSDGEEPDLADDSSPMTGAEFIRHFILPAFLIWIAGIVWVVIAFRWGNWKSPTEVPCEE